MLICHHLVHSALSRRNDPRIANHSTDDFWFEKISCCRISSIFLSLFSHQRRLHHITYYWRVKRDWEFVKKTRTYQLMTQHRIAAKFNENRRMMPHGTLISRRFGWFEIRTVTKSHGNRPRHSRGNLMSLCQAKMLHHSIWINEINFMWMKYSKKDRQEMRQHGNRSKKRYDILSIILLPTGTQQKSHWAIENLSTKERQETRISALNFRNFREHRCNLILN